jgi:hypothetical protein
MHFTHYVEYLHSLISTRYHETLLLIKQFTTSAVCGICLRQYSLTYWYPTYENDIILFYWIYVFGRIELCLPALKGNLLLIKHHNTTMCLWLQFSWKILTKSCSFSISYKTVYNPFTGKGLQRSTFFEGSKLFYQILYLRNWKPIR